MKDIVHLDTETLSLRVNAAVWELYALRETVTDDYQPLDNAPKSRAYHAVLDVLPQVAMGHHIDAETLKFLERTHGREVFQAIHGQQEPLVDPEVALKELRVLCKGADEVWIYKASFDYGVLQSLADSLDLGPVWGHLQERCLRTIVLSLGVEFAENDKRHRAAQDVAWNREMLKRYGAMRIAMRTAHIIEVPVPYRPEDEE